MLPYLLSVGKQQMLYCPDMKKPLAAILVLSLVAIVSLHFIPVQTLSGWLDQDYGSLGGSQLSGNLCQGYNFTTVTSANSKSERFRILAGGLHGFQKDKKYLHKLDDGCFEPVTLRLYLW